MRWAARDSWPAILQLVFPEQANAAHLTLDGARHAIQPGRDLLVGVAFDFPECDLPQFGLLERVQQAPALVGQLGGLRRVWARGSATA